MTYVYVVPDYSPCKQPSIYMAEKQESLGMDKSTDPIEEGQNSDSGRDSPTDLRVRLDLHAGVGSNESSDTETLDERRGFDGVSSATSVESVIYQEQLAQHYLGSMERLSQHTISSSQQTGSGQNLPSDDQQASSRHYSPIVAVNTSTVSTTEAAAGAEPDLTQYAMSSNFTETSSQKLSLVTQSTNNGGQSSKNTDPSDQEAVFRIKYTEVKSTDPEDANLRQTGSLSQHEYTSMNLSSVEIPRLNLGFSDDEGTADLGLPYSDGEFTSRTTDRQMTGRMDGILDPQTPESQITSAASDLSARALNRAMSELEDEEHVREAIEQVSSEFVDGEMGYFHHSMVESVENREEEETFENGEEEKKSSVYHICEPWSDQDGPDAWSTSSSKEVTPREVKKAADNFRSVLLDDAPVTPGMQRFLLSSNVPGASGYESIHFAKTPGSVRPLDASTPFHRETPDAMKSRDAVRVASETVDTDAELDRTLVEEEFDKVRSPAREFRTPPRSSPSKLSPSPERTASLRLFPYSSPSSISSPPADRPCPHRSYSEGSLKSNPDLKLYKFEATNNPQRRVSRRHDGNSQVTDTDDELVFQELPSGIMTSEDEHAGSIVSRSTYKDLPCRQTPEQIREAESDRSLEDSLGDTICREIEDFLVLHAQAKALRSDPEAEYSEDSVAQKVQELLERCEMERLSERSTVVGSGSVISDDLSDQDDVSDNEDRLADRVRVLMEKVIHADQEELDDKMPDDSLAKRIRSLLEHTDHHEMESSPRTSPRGIHELIHSISINRSADLDVHRELEDIQANWERRKNRHSPGSQTESMVSVATSQSKNSDEYTKKRLAWDYGADLEERNLPQFVASVKASDDEHQYSRQRARSVSLSHEVDDGYRVNLPAKSTSLLRVDRSDISLNTLREERIDLAQRVFSLLQKESPQEHAYSILREAEEQEKELARRSKSPRYPETEVCETSTTKIQNLIDEERYYSVNDPHYDVSAGHLQYYGQHKRSESLETVKSNVESQLSLKTSSTMGSTIRGHFADLHRPVSSPSLMISKSRGGNQQDLRESDLESRASGKRKREEDNDTSSGKSHSFTNVSQKSSFTFSPVSNKPYLASNTAQSFLSGQLQMARERQLESIDSECSRAENIPDHSIRGKPRPSIIQRFVDQNETNHDASREISQIQKPYHQDSLRRDLVTLRQVMQHRDISSSVETSQAETTIESTHTGSDDAQAPSFASYVYGTRVDQTAPHWVGVYGNRSRGSFLIFPESGETTARSDLSESTMSRKRAWVEERIEETEETHTSHELTEESKENVPNSDYEPRREPRRSLKILQEILEKESDSEASEIDGVWARYQQRKLHIPKRSENVLRLLRSLAEEKKSHLGASGEMKTRSTLSAISSIKTEGSWKIESNSWKFVQPNADFRMSEYGSSEKDLTESAPAPLNLEDQSPRSDKTVTSSTTDDDLRQRMATILDQTDSLTSIPEEKTLDSGKEDEHNLRDSPLPTDPHLAKIHMKIRLQREKYLKERRREQKRKEKIDKLEKILEAKTIGQDVTESSSASTSQSSITTTSNVSDMSSTIESGRNKTVCAHDSHDSDISYCPCKFGAKIHSPPRPETKPKTNVGFTQKTSPVYMEFAKPTTPERKPWVQKKKKDRGVQTKEKVGKENEEKLDHSSEFRVKLVSEGTQTSPNLMKQEEKKRKGKKKLGEKDRKEGKHILKSRENCEPRTMSRNTQKPGITLQGRTKKKSAPRGNSGGMCWFIPLNEGAAEVSRRSAEFVAQHRKQIQHFKDNLSPDEVFSGTEFSQHVNVDNKNKISLQDAFAMFKQRFISRSRERQKRVCLLAHHKRMDLAHQRQREALFSLKRQIQVNPQAHPLSDMWYKPQKRQFTKQEMKTMTEKVYRRLPEVVVKAEIKKREAEYRNNRMRAEIYKRKQLSRVLVKT